MIVRSSRNRHIRGTMSAYVLTLHHKRCPDGAEFVPHPWVKGSIVRWPAKIKTVRSADGKQVPADGVYPPVIRFRSERRTPYRRRLERPDQLIVTDFINAVPLEKPHFAVDYTSMLKFVSEYGYPLEFVSKEQLMNEAMKGKLSSDKIREIVS